MKIFTTRRFAFLILTLLISVNASAQSMPAAETSSKECAEPNYCLGERLPYESYSTDTTKTLQNNLRFIYDLTETQRKDLQAISGPLSDGKLGEVTFRLMNRFCADYLLCKVKNIVAELPPYATCVADFAGKYPKEHSLLISKDFKAWLVAEKIPSIFNKCDVNQWLSLTKRYLARNTPQLMPTPEEKKEPNTLYKYVLTADDLTKLQQPNKVPAAIRDLADKTFPTAADADAAIKKIPLAETQQNVRDAISEHLTTQTIYQFTEANLSALADAGFTALQISELNKLPKTVFTDEDAFKQLIGKTLENVPIATTSTVNSTGAKPEATPEQKPAEPQPEASTPVSSPEDIELAQIRVVNATKSTQIKLEKNAADKIVNEYFPHGKTIDPVVIKAISSLQDIEYPDGELFHSAAMDKIVKAMAVCRRNDSNSVDVRMLPMTTDEQKALQKLVLGSKAEDKQLFVEGTNNICDETFLKDVAITYNRDYKPAITLVYRKQAPVYEGKNILWSGNKCGCIPPQITVSAYGIYPYWQQSDTRQNFDFSTFSRVGYYGFSFNGNGQITQANTQNQSQTLLDINSNISPKFVTVARTFGSKLDWVIEKDWNEEKKGGIVIDEMKISETLNGLRNNIVSLLTRPLNDPIARIRPWSSLGIAPVPTMGDGVTLYFKNYPETSEAKKVFESFFRGLKTDLKKIDTDNKHWYSIKQDHFVNLIVPQEDYLSSTKLFRAKNIFSLLNVTYKELEPLTAIGEQNRIQTLVLVLLKEPYYNALTKLQGSLTVDNRSYILPTVVMDFRNFSAETNQIDGNAKTSYDERRKIISFQREAFGGGAFWNMPMADAPETDGFNTYISDNTALGFEHNLWDDTVCAYRWLIIDIMNAWLCIALLFVLIVFYIFPHQCRHLTGVARLLTEPPALAFFIIPPIALWIYLLAVDDSFPFESVPSFLNILLLVLSAVAVVKSIRELKQRKPTRDLAQLQTSHLPKRQQPTPVTSLTPDGDDENELSN